MHLLVGVDVAQLGNLGQALFQERRPVNQVVEIIGLQRVLILGAAVPAADAEVLHGLEHREQRRERSDVLLRMRAIT